MRQSSARRSVGVIAAAERALAPVDALNMPASENSFREKCYAYNSELQMKSDAYRIGAKTLEVMRSAIQRQSDHEEHAIDS